jgi:PAS domain S-box-containing protein
VLVVGLVVEKYVLNGPVMADKPRSQEELIREIQVLRGKVKELENLNYTNGYKDFKDIKEQIEFILGITKTGLDIIDSDYNIRYIDPSWRNIYGNPQGKKCYQYFMGAKEVCPTCGIPQALKTQKPVVSEEILIKENSRPIQVTTIPFKNYKGEWLVAEVNVDITERKKNDDVLKEIQLQQKAILDNIPDIAWLKDKESRFLAANEPFGKSCGYDPKDLVGKTDLDIWPKELAERYRTDDREVIKSGRRKIVEEPLADKEGKKRWLETIKTPIYNDKGKVIGTTGIARDITERKRMEEELKRAYDEMGVKVEERTRYLNELNRSLNKEISEHKKTDRLLTKLKDCFLVFGPDPDKNIKLLVALCGAMMNPACALYNRLENDKLHTIGQWNTPPDFKLVDIAQGHICADVIEEGKNEFKIIRGLKNTAYAKTDPNVGRYNLETYIGKAIKCGQTAVGSLCVVFNSDVKPNKEYLDFFNIISAAIGVEEDRKLAQKELQESENLYHAIVALSPEAIAVHSEGKIVFVNQAGSKLFGAENAQQIIGRPTMSFVHPDSREMVVKRISKMLKGAEGVPMVEEKFLRLDGTTIDVDVAAQPLTYKGKKAVQVIVRDVTEHKKIERMKANLIRDISHKLKNPVAMAEMAYDMCLQGMKKQDMKILQTAHNIIFNNLNSLHKDIDAILSYNALIRRKKPESKKIVLLKKTIKLILQDLGAIITDKKIKVKIDIPKQAGNILIGPNDIKIILYNLIDNAIKFTSQGSIYIMAQKTKQAMTITVKDTGIGIAQADQEMIFETFYQKSPSRSGTGLGLAICKEIIERYGGDIKINSAGEGRGTVVTVILPQAKGGKNR